MLASRSEDHHIVCTACFRYITPRRLSPATFLHRSSHGAVLYLRTFFFIRSWYIVVGWWRSFVHTPI